MTAPLLLLSTCGTSVLTNGATEEMRSWLKGITNLAQLTAEDASQLDQLAVERRRQFESGNATRPLRRPAELDGVYAVLKRWTPDRVQHVLVTSDTVVGEEAARIVEGILSSDRHQVQRLTACGLRTDDAGSFREALADLTRQIEELVPSYRKQGWTTVFNLTGGFKSVNAYIQALGMLHADRCVFLFEDAALMEIPQLPVRLADGDEVRVHLTTFRRLALHYRVQANDVTGIPDSLLLVDGEDVTTSVWGDVVWARVRHELLAESLLRPLSSKLILNDRVRRQFETLQADRRVMVNDALDALSAYLDDVRPLLKSHTFKQLQGKPKAPATHELYVWSDGAAWRLFGHFDGERFVADSLEPHL